MLNSRNLSALRSDVRVNVETLISMCKEQGLPILITQTVRDDEYQAYLYAQGRTRPGSIITNSKTSTFHKKGLAIDFCRNVKGHEYDDKSFFENVAIIAKHIGFSWGGDWSSFVDRPHLQWDNHGKYTTAMLRKGVVAPTMPQYNHVTDIRYNRISEMPDWAKPTIEKLIKKKLLTGSGTVKDEKGLPADLDLSMDMMRMFVINDRAKLY